jgi:broad specificity phosphatase PhoE
MSKAQVVLVRHGETEWSRSGQHTSTTDLELTAEGRRQAEQAGALLAGRSWSLVLTSPRRRARETAQLAGVGALAQVDDDLAEWNYGQYEGLTSAEILERHPGWSLWRDGCPGGEDAAAVSRRADRVIARARSVEGDVLVFAHGHILRVCVARWIGLDAPWGRAFTLATASISTLGWDHHEAAIAEWNNTRHLTALPR